MSRQNNIKRLLLEHNRHLQGLKEKQARYGAVDTPVFILTEIADTEAEIEKLQTELKQLELEASGEITQEISGPTLRSYVEFGKTSLAILLLIVFGVSVFFFLRSQTTSTPANLAVVTPNTPTASLTSILPTNTVETSTNTPTPRPTDTPIETSTPPPATPTPTPTLSPVPTSTPIPTPTPQSGLIIDDFENYNNTSIVNDFVINRNAGNEGSVTLVGSPHLYQGRQALAFQFDIRNSSPNHYIGFDREFSPQDWSNYSSLCLWVESDGSNRSLVVQFGESKYKFWKNIASLANIGTGEHCISLREGHQLDVRAIGYYGIYVEGPPQGQSIIYIDNIRIAN